MERSCTAAGSRQFNAMHSSFLDSLEIELSDLNLSSSSHLQ